MAPTSLGFSPARSGAASSALRAVGSMTAGDARHAERGGASHCDRIPVGQVVGMTVGLVVVAATGFSASASIWLAGAFPECCSPLDCSTRYRVSGPTAAEESTLWRLAQGVGPTGALPAPACGQKQEQGACAHRSRCGRTAAAPGRRPLAAASSAMASVSTTPHAPSRPLRQGTSARPRYASVRSTAPA